MIIINNYNKMKIILIIEIIIISFKKTLGYLYCEIDRYNRTDCGKDIDESTCKNKNCCWDPLEDNSKEPWCFLPLIITTIPTTIITTIPTTIPTTSITTIPTTLITTIPTIIITTIPTTIPTTIITTIPTTIPTTSITTIQTTIPTTIITTIPTIIPTTSITTIPTTLITTIPTSLITNNPTTIISTIFTEEITITSNFINCEEKCLRCDNESKKLNLCISCNEPKNYYKVNYNNNPNQIYYDCILRTSPKLKKFYFNITTNEFRPCYETCETCEKEGDSKFHNCLTCDANHMFRPDGNPPNNCVANCKFYYISPYGQFKCLETLECPEESKLLIKEKNKCTNDCKKDDIYKYQYNGMCLENCPENTENDNFLCKEIDPDKCKLSEKDIELNKGLGSIETLVKAYSEEFSYTNNHISKFKNNEYNIIIYKNENCINELSINLPKVNFGNCYIKVKEEYKINEDLIIVIADKLNQNNPSTSYSFFHPKTGEKLEAETICKDETIIVEEKLLSFLNENDTNYDLMIFLTNQKINIFNISDEFYTNICYEYESPVNKDIPLKDRITTFYPNVTLCDEGCTNSGINLDDMTAKCNCKFNDIANNDLIKDNVLLNSLVSEVFDIINNSNIAVFKCYKYIFKYFSRSYGGFISLFLLIGHIILSTIFLIYELNNIKRYVFSLTENYIKLISQPVNKNYEPPPKRIKSSNKSKKDNNKEKNIKAKNSKKKILNTISISTNMINISKIKTTSKENLITNFNSKLKNLKLKTTNEINKQSEKEQNLKKNEQKNIKYFNEYLATALDDMDYDDALIKDDRKFCEYFYETLKEKQIIANTFFASDMLKTRTLKIIIFILNIILYLVVNGLFFSENYVSEVYNLEGEEGFFDFFPRSIDRFFYTTVVSIIVGFIVDFFFVEEKKIKGIFIREKESTINIKIEIINFLKQMKKRYILFIIIVLIILLISLYYILCFNYVYPHMQIEWIKSSIVIMLILQILSILTCLLETILRFISFHFKSERIYKISKLIS